MIDCCHVNICITTSVGPTHYPTITYRGRENVFIIKHVKKDITVCFGDFAMKS